MTQDVVGWFSAAVLVLTISRQVYTQWRTRSIVGQITASIGFTFYSYLVGNWVFVFANFFILLTAVAGECIYLRNRRLSQRSGGGDSARQ